MRRVARLTLLLSLLAAHAAAAAEIAVTATGRDGGPPHAGETVRLEFAIEDGVTGFPISGLHLRGWLRPAPADGDDCELAARRLLKSGANPHREVALEGIDLLTVDRNGTTGLIDPKLDLATANLVAVSRLDGPVGDLEPLAEHGMVAASLPEGDAVLLLDAASGRVERTIDLPRGSAPGDLLHLEGVLWIALEGAVSLIALDPEAGSLEAPLRVSSASAPIELDADRGERWLVALERRSGAIAVVDALRRTVVATRPGSGKPGALVVSALARMAYRLSGRRLEAFLLPELEPVRVVDLPFAAATLALTADGRWIFAYGGESGDVAIVDVAANHLLHRLAFQEPPQEIGFTSEIAWLRFAGRAGTVLVPLRELDDGGSIGVAELPTGSRAPGSARLPLLAAVPGHGGMMLAGNPADRAVYVLMQGMLAPMSSIAIKTGRLDGMLAIDRAPVEAAPGRYVVFTRTPGSGELEAVLWLDRLEEAHCLPIGIEGAEAAARDEAPPRVQLAPGFARLTAGEEDDLRILVRSSDGTAPIEGVEDLGVLLLDPRTGWHARRRAAPSADGGYALRIALPRPGRYRLLVHSRALGIRYEDTPLMLVEADR